MFLIGPPGAGKTAVGRALAKRLEWPFVDLDEEIAARVDKKVSSFLSDCGEERFRQAERDTLRGLLPRVPLVLACGGGTPCWYDNLERMAAVGFVVSLTAELETLVERTAEGGRPLLLPSRKQRLETLLWERASWYERADLAVGTDARGVGDVVDVIVEALRSR